MAMAMHSVRTYPSLPTKTGTLLRGFTLRNSGVGLVVSTSTTSKFNPLAFATARIAVVRGLSYAKIPG